MRFFSYICHQKEERCLRFRGRTMPVCARCLAFYLFFPVGCIAFLFAELSFGASGSISLPVLVGILGISQLPMLVDGGLQLKGRYESTNGRRFVTGALSGLGFGLAVTWVILQLAL